MMDDMKEKKPARLEIFRQRFYELSLDYASITDFADAIGITRQTCSYYLSGNRLPDAVTLLQICERCKVSSDWLLGLSSERALESDVRAAAEFTGLSSFAVSKLHQRKEDPADILEISFIRKLVDSIINVGDLDLSKAIAAVLDAAEAHVIAESEGDTAQALAHTANYVTAITRKENGYRIPASVAEDLFLNEAQAAICINLTEVIGRLEDDAIAYLRAGQDFYIAESPWKIVDEEEGENGDN